MNQKQLANVLINILGLSMIAHGIISLLNAIFGLLQFVSDNRYPLFSEMVRNSHNYLMVILDLFPVALGLAFIFGSRWLTEKLINDE